MKWCKKNYLISNGLCIDNMRECVKENCNQWQPVTQIDQIKSMSVDEMAKFLNKYTPITQLPKEVEKIWRNNNVSVLGAWKIWLESEVDTE